MTQGSPLSSATDEDLLRRHVKGDAEAFGVLVERHQDRLWAVALRTLGDPYDAADALQEALINAFRRAASFRSESAVTTWLHRIVVNACLDRVRHNAARPAEPVAFDGTEVSAMGGAVSATGGHSAAGSDARQGAGPAADPAEHTALRVDLERALFTLTADQRLPLVLVDVEGYSVADAAQMLGVPVGTVKSRCARARAKLLPLLSPGRIDPAGNREPPDGVSSTGTSSEPGRGGEDR